MAVVCSAAVSILDLIMMDKKTGHTDVTSWNMNEFSEITKGWFFYFEQDFRCAIGPCSEIIKEQQLAKKRCPLKQVLALKISHVSTSVSLTDLSYSGASSSFTERFGIALSSWYCLVQYSSGPWGSRCNGLTASSLSVLQIWSLLFYDHQGFNLIVIFQNITWVLSLSLEQISQ